MGKTFTAVDESVSPPLPCVVKQLKIHSQASAEWFEQRSHKLKELAQHPQIPTLLDAWQEENGNIYLIHEWIEGNNLAQLIENKGVFNEAETWQILNELLPILKFIHEQQVIHGDIKPENIICRENKAEPWGMRSQVEPRNEGVGGRFVLVDWGAVQVGMEVESFIGSAEYVAPEQARGKAVFASDLYSLGVSCLYLLTGISPFNLFDGVSDRIIWRQDVEVSDRLAFILDKLTQNDLNQRFQSADEVIQLLGHKSKIQNLKSKIQNPKSKIQNSPCLRTLTGHAGLFAGVNSVAISPDNRILASGSDDKTIRLWDVETGDAIATLFGHTNFVQSVAFSPVGVSLPSGIGTILASGSDDKTIKLWDLKTYQEICSLSGHLRAVKSVTFNPIPPNPPYQGGREENSLTGNSIPPNPPYQGGLEDNCLIPPIQQGILASGSWDKTIKLWDLQTKEVICTLSGHQLQVTSVAFSPEGKFLASASFDRTVRLWDWQNLETLQPKFRFQILLGHTWPVFSVAFSPKGEILATGGDDKTIKLWDVKTGETIHTLLGHSWSVVAVAFSPDGQTLVSGSWDKTIKLWNVSTGEEIATLAGHLDAVCAIAVSPDGQMIASGSKDKTIKLWRLSQ